MTMPPDDFADAAPARPVVYLIAIVAAAGGFTFGYDLVIMSGAILFLKSDFALSAGGEGFAMTSAMLGVIAGLLIAAPIADRVGRKWTLIVTAILFMLSAIGTAWVDSFVAWNAWRILGGIGGGIASVVSPMYIAEIAPARIRGLLVTINQLAIVLGALASAVVAWAISISLEADQWRWMFASECPAVLVFLAGLPFIPLSPRWLVQGRRTDEAHAVLTTIGGTEHADRELSQIQETMSEQMSPLAALFERRIRPALIIAVALAAFQQFCGVSTLTLYAPTLFESAGITSSSDAILGTVILRIWNLSCTVFALLVVDRLGRRPLLLWGLVGMAVGQILMGVSFQFDLPAGWLLTAMFLGEGAYIVSLAPLAWLIMSEIFPTDLRARGMALAALVLQASAYAVGTAFPIVRDEFEKQLGQPGLVFWIFALVCIIAFVFCQKMVPETKGTSLEDIAALWDSDAAELSNR